MRLYELIKRKRDGRTLTGAEIHWVIDGYMKGEIADYQVSALLMAIYFRGLNARESWDLTEAMMRSGKVLDLSFLDRPRIDKHSTGGVGDKVSLILAPLAAAAGVCVPMMSGRGLGHTGGTLDKLSAIRGFRVDLSEAELVNQLRQIGVAMIGQTKDLVPADRRIYALRDVTATVDCIPLIAASIMSKKLAEGIQGLLLDVKVGSGAFMKTISQARRLARTMVQIGYQGGCEVVALITDMDQPLGQAVGNALEVREALEVLRGGGPRDVRLLCIELGAWMMKLGKLDRDLQQARIKLQSLLDQHKALLKFKELVSYQGGDPAVIDNPDLLPSARFQIRIPATRSGYVSQIQTEPLGHAAMILGAGRDRMDSQIDPAVGLIIHKKRGDRVIRGEALAVVHANDQTKARQAVPIIQAAYGFSDRPPKPRPLIHTIITKRDIKKSN